VEAEINQVIRTKWQFINNEKNGEYLIHRSIAKTKDAAE